MRAVPAQTPLHFAHLTTEQAAELRASSPTTVLLWPVGATEPHGPHAPLATDLIIAEGMCHRLATSLREDPELGALILPTLPFGVTRYARAFTGCIHVEEETLHAMILDVARSLAAQGFDRLVVVNCHFEPEHVGTLHRALADAERETGGALGYLDLTRRERAARLTEEFKRGESHADRYETSLVLAERPELVDQAVAQSLPTVDVNMARAIADGLDEFTQMGLERAYAGSPAKARAAEGEAIFATLAEMLEEVVRTVAAGMGGRDEPGLFGRG